MARFLTNWLGHGKTEKGLSRRFCPRLTLLQDRCLPSATLSNGFLSILGTTVNIGRSGPDDIITIRRVADNLFVDEQDGVLAAVTTHGPFPVYGKNPVTRISIDAKSGGDRINIESIQALIPVDVFAGAGDDHVSICPVSKDLSNILGSVITVDGGTHFSGDSLFVFDTNNKFSATYTVTEQWVGRLLSGTVYYSNFEGVLVSASQGNSTLRARGLPSGVNLNFDGNGGNDTVNVGNTANKVAEVKGAFDVEAEVVRVYDQGSTAGGAFGVTNQKLSLPAGGSLLMSPQQFEVNCGSGADSISLLTLPTPQLPFTINPGSGDNSFSYEAPLMANSNWTITGPNAGSVNGYAFSGYVELHGGRWLDHFTLSNGIGFKGLLDGGNGFDALDYSAYLAANAVTVNLATNQATDIPDGAFNFENVLGGAGADSLTGTTANNIIRGGAGADTLTAGGGNDIVLAEDGADTLIGGPDYDILVGGANADTLQGDSGYDILIGGSGLDTLQGGSDSDILIGTATAWDNDGASLVSLLQRWSTVVVTMFTMTSYPQRISAVSTGAVAFTAATVLRDSSVDVLTGGSGSDWFVFGAIQPMVLLQPDDNVTDQESVNWSEYTIGMDFRLEKFDF